MGLPSSLSRRASSLANRMLACTECMKKRSEASVPKSCGESMHLAFLFGGQQAGCQAGHISAVEVAWPAPLQSKQLNLNLGGLQGATAHGRTPTPAASRTALANSPITAALEGAYQLGLAVAAAGGQGKQPVRNMS